MGKYSKRYDEINHYLEREHLNEQFVPATLSVLDNAIKDDPELKKFLTTKGIDLPPKYRFLVDEIGTYKDHTLYDLMYYAALSQSGVFTNGLVPLFSMAGGKLKWFTVYRVEGETVSEIKMFSFDPDNGSYIIRDLMRLLDDLVKKYKTITWFAFPANPANKIYQRAIEHYNGSIINNGNKITYRIENET